MNIEAGDALVLPFSVEALDVRGRVARMGAALDNILRKHNYPQPVSRLLGEAVLLNVLFATALKIEGRVILQIQSDGPVSLLVTDFTTPDGLRGYARFDPEGQTFIGGDGTPETLEGFDTFWYNWSLTNPDTRLLIVSGR